MLTYLADYENIFGPLRLFQYLTLRMVMAAATALIIGFLVAPKLFQFLRSLKASQSLRTAEEVGKLADLHAKKKDTPTMGGLMIYIAVTVSALLWTRPSIYLLVVLLVYTGLTIIGFLDDYLKVSKRNSKGLSGRWKLIGQVLVTIVALGLLLGSPSTHGEMSEFWTPFYKFPLMKEMPIWFAFIFFFLVMAGSSNAINLTDGVDGLAIGCTVTVAMAYGIMAYAAGNVIISNYLLISYVPGVGELAVVCSALGGGSLAFLWYNSHPAEVFMGDTGSLALGGLIGSIAFIVHQPLTLIVVGGIFVLEAASVILQVGSFKLRGKRIFRMAPLHHHFELLGWHESKVVIRFWIVSLIFAIAGLSTLKMR
ncbi:phospho-N-acetylmuramoyl-pentapeptide-transferase [Rubellicoccus peritrichatus]|uniref:Phospho-N-acetylmuramoyl-pentapeptide-transferase n=1 Tax=Rubellicoccus peritrichatus TaxID=3080537 RepID=A0AAQ3LJT3_9BACT|nr:phospho-N-acetylmuramoyl-pentapeptide-transferase [Puniceicoccus sp. CR14]WOO43549.1 phospho-N-acetylmuramoyl-pentapeptide-transferase [Puniceicoccus sp. CR14]